MAVQTNTPQSNSPAVRAAVFPDVAEAQRAIRSLLTAHFTPEHITVVCSDETKERHFKKFDHQQPAGQNTPAAAAAGGTIGGTAGGLTGAAIGAAVGGPAFALFGGAGLITGALVGSFLGAMLTRGLEKAAADYYDQSVQDGKILVVVEDHGANSAARLDKAAQILATAGAQPLELPEG
jgi:hypothetical protein